MNKNALIVITSNDKLGDSGKKTGWYLSEVSHVYWPLVNDGFNIEFASPKGGLAPLDLESCKLDDPENKSLVKKYKIMEGIQTKAISEIDPNNFSVIYFAGGHGTMWDFPDNNDIERVTSTIFENGGIVAAVCHGPSALTSIKLSDGKYLVDGRNVNSFTNEEEREVQKDSIVPFLLEDRLRERGANFQSAGKWQNKVVISDRLITGQNPQSASSLGNAIVNCFSNIQNTYEKTNSRRDKSEQRPDLR